MKGNFYIRSVLFMIILFIGSRVYSQTTAAQKAPLYFAEGSGFSSKRYLGGNVDVVYCLSLGSDSMMITNDTANNRHTATYKRDTVRHFFKRVNPYENSDYSFVMVYKRAILIMWPDSSYIFYLQNKDKAHNYAANDPRLRIIKDSIVAVADSMYAKEYKEKVEAAAFNRRKILNAFAAHWTSQRTDPALVRDVIKWSGLANITVYIASGSYYYMRSYAGVVLREYIPIVYKYVYKNKCYLQYRMLGYEALNGGNFSTDLKDYTSTTTSVCPVSGAGSVFNMVVGTPYEIDCP